MTSFAFEQVRSSMSTKPQETDLQALLAAASIIAGSGDKGKKKIGSNVVDVLKSRLVEFRQVLEGSGIQSNLTELEDIEPTSTTSQIEIITGDVAVWTLDYANRILLSVKGMDQIGCQANIELSNTAYFIIEGNGPAVGLRDLGTLRTLAALSFRWAVGPRLDRILKHWVHLSPEAVKGPLTGLVEVEDTEAIQNTYQELRKKVEPLLRLVTEQDEGRVVQHLPLAFIVIPQHVTALLKACIAFGWGPDKSQSVDMKSAARHILDMSVGSPGARNTR